MTGGGGRGRGIIFSRHKALGSRGIGGGRGVGEGFVQMYNTLQIASRRKQLKRSFAAEATRAAPTVLLLDIPSISDVFPDPQEALLIMDDLSVQIWTRS